MPLTEYSSFEKRSRWRQWHVPLSSRQTGAKRHSLFSGLCTKDRYTPFTVEHKSAGRNKVIVGKRSAPQLFDDMLGSIKQIQVTEEILAKLLFARLVAHSSEYKKASLHRTFTCYGVHTGINDIARKLYLFPCSMVEVILISQV